MNLILIYSIVSLLLLLLIVMSEYDVDNLITTIIITIWPLIILFVLYKYIKQELRNPLNGADVE